jgi:hypothetical protein
MYLHVVFVGNEGCLPALLSEKNITNLPYDTILKIILDKQYSPDVDESGSDMMMTDDGGTEGVRRRLSFTTTSDIYNNRNLKFDIKYNKKWKYYDIFNGNSRILGLNNNTISNSTIITNNSTSNSNITSPSSAPSTSSLYDIGEDFDYEFSPEIAILALPKKAIQEHNFKSVNVTYTGSKCFGSWLTQFLLPVGGVDTVVLNNVIYTMKKRGVLISKSGDYYTWSDKQYSHVKSLGEFIGKKIGILLFSLLSFMFLSTTTALIVRILISSGVVLLFPVFWVLHLFGVPIINTRILSLSYPWIGIPMEMLRARNQSTIPFLLAHSFRVIIYYVMYEACQMTFSSWFYDEARPGQRELWIFSIMMLWEYYSMIYVRSNLSIQLFPRASLALFLLYHFYIYSHPYGFSLLALLVMFLYLTALMIYCVRKYEVDAFFRGLVNIDQPRMIYNQLPWPSWTVALAPDYSLFLPLSLRTSSIYQQAVPAINAENENQQAQTPATTFNDYILNATNHTVNIINSIRDTINEYVARNNNSNSSRDNDRGSNIEINNRVNSSSNNRGGTSTNSSTNRYSRLDGSTEDDNNSDVEARR